MLRRLTLRLNRSFGDPPIVCHHDSHQVGLDPGTFPSNVRFVPKPLRTKWADYSVVQACLLALRQMYDWASPKWFIYLSGSDYPIRSGDAIASELEDSPYDAYLDYRRIRFETLSAENFDSGFDLGFRRPYWTKIAYDRYVARHITYPWINRKRQFCTRVLAIRHPSLIRPSPFKNGLACYGGDAWLSARARCAELLLSSDDRTRELHDHFRQCVAPDESFFHTILCNAPGLKLCNDNKRYEDWRSGNPNPKLLGIGDLSDMLASNQHFARKFSDIHDACVLDELDRLT